MDTAQVLPSGMTAGGQARLDKLISEYGYTSLGFVETKHGKVFLAEKKQQYQGSLYGRDGGDGAWRDVGRRLGDQDDAPLQRDAGRRRQVHRERQGAVSAP